MIIKELEAVDLVAAERITAFMEAVASVDAPWVKPMTPAMRQSFLETGWDGEPPRVFLGERDGELVAVGHLELPEYDNRHLAWTDVKVHPDHRRRGLGSELLRLMEQVAVTAGRRSLGSDGWDSEGARGFAARHRLELRSQAIERVMYLERTDLGLVAELVSEAAEAAADYELVRVFGRTPPEIFEQVVDITSAINDAPTDDLDIEDEVFTRERHQAYEDATLRNHRLYSIFARHRSTGALAGKTVVAVELERPHLSHQHDTSVVRAHRGHRLGLLLKGAMVQWLVEQEPQLREISTWNTETNDHMIGINEQLGYVVKGRNLEFQRDL